MSCRGGFRGAVTLKNVLKRIQGEGSGGCNPPMDVE